MGKPCETLEQLCIHIDQAHSKVLAAGCSPDEYIDYFLPESEQSRALREAHTKLTDTIGLLEILDDKLIKELGESYLMDIRKSIEQAKELVSNKILCKNACEV